MHFDPNSFYKWKTILFLVLLGCGLVQSASAQQCDIVSEVITKLQHPNFAAFHLWNAEYGDKGAEELFVGAIALPRNRVLALGEAKRLFKSQRDLVLAEIDYRGRVISRKIEKIDHLLKVIAILAIDGGYMVTGNVKPPGEKFGIWVGVYNLQGELLKEKVIEEKETDLFAKDLIIKAGNKKEQQIILLAAAKDYLYNKAEGQYTKLFTLNKDIEILENRSLSLGSNNGLHKISTDRAGNIYTVGYQETSLGRKSGWVIALDRSSKLRWEQSYGRGLGAEILNVIPYDDSNIIVTGVVKPNQDEAPTGAWIMMLRASNGDVVWQRYYTADFDMAGRGLYRHDDGQITAMLTAKNYKFKDDFFDDDMPGGNSTKKSGITGMKSLSEIASSTKSVRRRELQQDHVKIMRMNRRGVILDVKTHYNGKQFDGLELGVKPNGEMLIIGSLAVEYLPDTPVDTKELKTIKNLRKGRGTLSQDSAIVAFSSPERYKDPCLIQ